MCTFLNKIIASSWLWDCCWRWRWLWSRGKPFIPREVVSNKKCQGNAVECQTCPPRDSPSKKAECPVYYSFSDRFSISQHCWQWHYRNACLPREVTKQNLLVTARFLSWKVKAVSYFVTRACPNTHQLPCFTKEASGNLLGTCNVVFFPPTSLVFLLWVTSVILKFQSSSPRMWHRVTLMAANRIWASVSRKFCHM